MTLRFEKIALPAENELLIAFLTGETWPFHSGLPSRESVSKSIAAKAFDNPDVQSFWIRNAQAEELGLIKLFDLEDIGDGAPLFDLRIKAAARGQGVGKAAVTWLTKYLFEGWPELKRIEGTTRVDNLAMRAVFRACGYLKEGHYRQAWQGHDAIHYGLLRQDWETGQSTPVNWHDEFPR
jgi:RimJ/RimL family protein N-acetyltransferase